MNKYLNLIGCNHNTIIDINKHLNLKLLICGILSDLIIIKSDVINEPNDILNISLIYTDDIIGNKFIKIIDDNYGYMNTIDSYLVYNSINKYWLEIENFIKYE